MSKTKMIVQPGYRTDLNRELGAATLADAFLTELEQLLENYDAVLTVDRQGTGTELYVSFRATPDYRLRLAAGQLRDGLTFKHRGE